MKSGVQIIFSCKKKTEFNKLYKEIKKFLSKHEKSENYIEEELSDFHGADCYNTGYTIKATTIICSPVIRMKLYEEVISKRYSEKEYNFLQYKQF